MFNHRSDAQSDVSFNYFKNQFELVINKQYNINEQIYISYGKPSNDRLLQYYGFIEYNNPYDIYDYSNNIIDLLLKYSNNIEKKLTYPIYPDPSIRIQLIYIALKNTKVLSQLVSNKKEVTMSPPTSSSSSTTSSTTSTGKEEKPLRYYSSPIDGSTNDNDDTGNAESSKNQQSPSENKWMAFTRHYDDVSVRCLRLFFASESEWTLIQRAWKLDTTDLNTILTSTPTTTNNNNNNNINTNNIDLEIVGKPLSDQTESNIQKCLRIIAECELYDKPTTITQDLELLQILRKKSATKTTTTTGSNEKMGFGQLKTKGLSGTAASAAASVLQSGGEGELSEQILAVEFRIEKKKLLQRAMEI